MMAEILICVAIALIIMLGFGILIKFMIWLDENKGIDAGVSTLIIVCFILTTFGVWLVRYGIRESKESKLERRRI